MSSTEAGKSMKHPTLSHLLSAPTKENYSLSGLPSTAADIFFGLPSARPHPAPKDVGMFYTHADPPKSLPPIPVRVDLAEPCSPERTRTGYGPQLRSAASSQATASTKSLVVRTFKNGRSAEI